MSLPSFSMSFLDLDEKKRKRPSPSDPVDRACTTMPTPAGVQEVLEDHQPYKMMDNIALLIVDQTYAAVLEILGPAYSSDDDDDGHVEFSRPVDPADPDSPVLFVNASPTECAIRLADSTVCSEKSQPPYHDYLLARTGVSVSPGELHVAHRAAANGGPVEGWKCADDEVRPNVSEKGLFGVLEAIRARLDAAIRVEANLVNMAKASGCDKSPKLNDIIDVRMALDRMRRALDVDTIMRRRRLKRRRRAQEICRNLDVNLEAELLANWFSRTMNVGQNGCQPEAVRDTREDDADVLTKRFRTLHV